MLVRRVYAPVLIGLACLAFAAYWYASETRTLGRAVTTVAVIEEIRRGAPVDDDSGNRYYPTDARVRYQAGGAVVHATVPLGGACGSGSGRCPYRQGGTVTITYDPRNVTHAELPRRYPTFMWMMVPLAALGVALVAAGVAGWLVPSWRARAPMRWSARAARPTSNDP
jgi:hypothetical protein